MLRPARATPFDPPFPLRLAAGLVAAEAVVLLCLGALELASLRLSRLTMGATTAVFFVAAAAGLAWCAWSLWAVRRWARGPVVMAQLIQLGLAWNLRGEETRWVSLALAAVAVVVIVSLVHPASTAALEADARDGG